MCCEALGHNAGALVLSGVGYRAIKVYCCLQSRSVDGLQNTPVDIIDGTPADDSLGAHMKTTENLL
jgi:hypothetical protein